jgi:hypothetical protein
LAAATGSSSQTATATGSGGAETSATRFLSDGKIETPDKTRKIVWPPAVSQGDRHCNRLRIPPDRQPFESAHELDETLFNIQFLESERQ